MTGIARLSGVKMHGARNAFVLIDERPARRSEYAALAVELCSSAGGFDGADGLLVVREAPGFAAQMRIFNADGSEAEMCGNGIRCVARYLADRGAPESFGISTSAGAIGVSVVSREPFEARVDMGPVVFPNGFAAETVTAQNATWTFYDVSLGNPHAVIFVEDVDRIDLATLGVALNALDRFANGTNVHVVQTIGPTTLRVRHYERGVGMTQACGTGAVACAAAAISLGSVRSPVDVRVPGGLLRVAWAAGENALLTGPAEPMFERTIVL